MSLLNVYVIIAYYADAHRSDRYRNKITRQRFDSGFVSGQLSQLCSYQSSALHWNMEQLDRIDEVADRAFNAYSDIARRLNVAMHSEGGVTSRISALKKQKTEFMNLSRDLARRAQRRESITVQPKELVRGTKATVTIRNYLGGIYFLTADETRLVPEQRVILLVEAKHSKSAPLPSLDDIKDGLLKMVLFTNLSNVRLGPEQYGAKAVLKLTSAQGFNRDLLTARMRESYDLLLEEKHRNGFEVEVS